MRLVKSLLVGLAIFMAVVVLQAQAPTVFFTADWEVGGPIAGTGCSNIGLTDNLRFGSIAEINDYCTGNPDGPHSEVVTESTHGGADAARGTYAVRFNQYPSDCGAGEANCGGYDTILSKNVGQTGAGPRRDWYIRYYVWFPTGYWWHSYMKSIIMGGASGGDGQTLYLEYRGGFESPCGQNENQNIGAIWVDPIIAGQSASRSANAQVTTNTWHLIEWHIVSSTNSSTPDGQLEGKFDGVPMTWCNASFHPNALATADDGFAANKFSSYTNDSGDVTFQSHMPQFRIIDSVQYCTVTWCGADDAAPGGGGNGGHNRRKWRGRGELLLSPAAFIRRVTAWDLDND